MRCSNAARLIGCWLQELVARKGDLARQKAALEQRVQEAAEQLTMAQKAGHAAAPGGMPAAMPQLPAVGSQRRSSFCMASHPSTCRRPAPQQLPHGFP
jgi:hypothetical protein